jgi:uncharacterized protein
MPFEDLRQGRLDVVPNYYTVDLPFYRQHLQGFLPDKIIDAHTHAAPARLWQAGDPLPTYWPGWISMDCPMPLPNLLQALLMLFPGKEVTPIVLGTAQREGVEAATAHLQQGLQDYPHIFAFMNNLPEWSERELAARMARGRFSGLKPYPTLAPASIPARDAAIFDYLPRQHLKLAEENGWVITLHISREARLADPLNIAQLKEIAERFPRLKLVLAHIGRTYTPRNAEEGFAALGETARFFYWDFSATTQERAMELLIQAAGPQRILYGSDLPVVAARARRITEGENYVNIMREADWQDAHTRLAPPEEHAQITFLLYEEIAAFKRVAQRLHLTTQDIEDVFYRNARRLLGR